MQRRITEELDRQPGFDMDTTPAGMRQRLHVAKAYELLGHLTSEPFTESVTLRIERIRDGESESLVLKW